MKKKVPKIQQGSYSFDIRNNLLTGQQVQKSYDLNYTNADSTAIILDGINPCSC